MISPIPYTSPMGRVFCVRSFYMNILCTEWWLEIAVLNLPLRLHLMWRATFSKRNPSSSNPVFSGLVSGKVVKGCFMTSQQLFPRSTTFSPVFHDHGMPHPLFSVWAPLPKGLEETGRTILWHVCVSNLRLMIKKRTKLIRLMTISSG